MTNMSRVERRKAQNLYEDQNAAALADDYVDDDGESLPTRQSVKNQKEQKKKQGKTKTPLFTVLAVLFVFVPVIVLVTLFYLKSHPDNHDDYEDVFIDSSQSKYEVVPKSADKKDNEDTKVTKETALQQESKKKSEDTRAKEPAKTTTDQKQPAVAEKEDSANKEEATAAAASSSQQTAARQEQQPAEPVQPEPKRVVKHTVQKKETLYRISMKYYKSRSGEEKIRAYNHLNGNDVYTGQVLDIPLVD
ncbi:LysM peptidoglycan-binding domain-containing protein [Bacillus inaquosorum]|uniref:LysM peptidoglycan-binding domain-containing protein n=1 Tax=Bacillus inaquosorum TaxID=483913 RepID=UPI002DBC93AC|nr:LysM peptidoglycan-binding domain-containing protein [Bacillus inaquosorum]MEC2062920.1 LysM peptidoglycan-binding domain-containing protein [Bacillus inaquosorum]MEC2085937.1 LysM peptidoglycan-binding domain-containing protein [Bacillus inaquosorum]